jgi:transcriptional regulator with XRE-family HTH domain
VIGAHRYWATNLEAVLATQGRTRRWLADRLGVSESLVSKVLAGKKTVGREQGEVIADAVGVPFDLLFELRERSVIDTNPEQTA